jgi:hypothetical protein
MGAQGPSDSRCRRSRRYSRACRRPIACCGNRHRASGAGRGGTCSVMPRLPRIRQARQPPFCCAELIKQSVHFHLPDRVVFLTWHLIRQAVTFEWTRGAYGHPLVPNDKRSWRDWCRPFRRNTLNNDGSLHLSVAAISIAANILPTGAPFLGCRRNRNRSNSREKSQTISL